MVPQMGGQFAFGVLEFNDFLPVAVAIFFVIVSFVVVVVIDLVRVQVKSGGGLAGILIQVGIRKNGLGDMVLDSVYCGRVEDVRVKLDVVQVVLLQVGV